MKISNSYPIAILAVILCQQAHSARIFSDTLTSWTLSLNNGVAYITSPQLPANCSPLRVQINMSGAEYDKALFSFALDAKNRRANIRVVVDDTQAECVVFGIQ
jgi:hypothetical protein